MEEWVRLQLRRAADRFLGHLREGVGGGFACFFRVEGLSEDALLLDVVPDGITWIAKIWSGERIFFQGNVEPNAFQENLYFVLLTCAQAMRTEAKAS